MKKRGLRKKIIRGFFVFEILLIAYVGCVLAYGLYSYRMEENTDIIYKYLKSGSDFINGDKIEEYISTGETDEYYDIVVRYLETMRKRTNIETYCVFVPREDDVVYVWMSSEGETSYDWLNHHENYMENGKETRDATFRKDPEEFVSKYEYQGEQILAGFYPIFNSAGEPVALIDIDLSFPDTMKSILLSILSIIAGVIVISIIIGRLLYVYFDRILIKPIGTLNTEAKRMIENLDKDDAAMTGVHTGDELEELSDSFEQMNIDVRRYINENISMAAEKERISADLELASKIQRGMLPSPSKDAAIKDVKGFDLYASMTPAREVGGDFYDYYMLDDSHLVILIADVSDKGTGAAFFMAISKTLIKARAGMGGSADEIIAYVDKMISEKNEQGMFVTVWFAIIDLETGKVNVCNAGHDYPAIMKVGQDYSIEKTLHGPPIGFIPGAKFNSYDFDLSPGDRIFLYTDGINEAKRPDGERFGFDRLLEVLNSNKEASSEELVETVKNSVIEFAAEEPQFDDMTVLSFTFEGR